MKFNLIQVQTVSGCNGNCVFCPSSYSWMKKHPGKMSDEDYVLVLDRIKEAHPDFDGQFCPYLMNEPTLDEKLIERIELAFKYFPKCNIEVSTNAMKLTPKLAEQLVEVITKNDKSRKSHIWISHHAIDKESYETLMRRQNYAQTLNNIIEYLMINDGQIITILRGSGASADGSLVYFTEKDYHEYWVKIFKENNLNPANVKVDYYQFHNRAGEVKMEGWEAANNFYRAIDKYHSFSCWRFISGLHVLYNLDVVPCFPPDSKVLTESGLKDIKNIRVGELVYSHDGKLHRVTKTYRREVSEKIFKITLRKYKLRPIRSTKNHPFLVMERESGAIMWKEAQFLSSDDMIFIPKLERKNASGFVTTLKYLRNTDIVLIEDSIFRINGYTKRILKNSKVPHILKLSRDMMWVFGIYLAEGHVNSSGDVVFSLNRSEGYIIERILKTLEDAGIENPHAIRMYRRNNMDLVIFNSNLGVLLKKWFGNRCDTKFIHSDILKYSSRVAQMSLVDGFLTGDGCRNDRKFRLVTTSEKLASQLYLILRDNNKLANFYKYKHEGKKDAFELDVNTSETNGKHRIHLEENSGYWLPIAQIEQESYSGDVYNLEVEEANSYLVDGLFSAHNCCMDYSCKYIWGNLRRESIKEIWNGEKRKDFVDKATGLKPSDSDFICKRCMSVGG